MRFPSPCRPLACLAAVATALAMASPCAVAQPGSASGADPLSVHLFPPEMVMAHQREIGLDAGQRQNLIEEIQALQSEIVPWQLEMSEAGEALAGELAEPEVDEAAALALAERITGLEARIKHRHLALLIRIKNLLSVEQQDRLAALR